jgi:hypothetical protein
MDLSGGASLAIKGTLALLKAIFKRPLELIEKACFYEAYRISSVYKTHRDYRLLWNHELGDYVNFHINWKKLFLGEEQQLTTLWIKAKDGKEFSEATFCITASLETIRYQSIVTVHQINKIPCVLALPSIPLRKISVRGNMVRMAYSDVSIDLKGLFDSDGSPITLRGSTKILMHPMDNIEAAIGLRKSEVYRWGKWWNLDFLESEKNEISILLQALAFRSQYDRKRFTVVWTFLARLGKKKWFLSCYFWSKNILFASALKIALNDYLEEDSLFRARQNAKSHEDIQTD